MTTKIHKFIPNNNKLEEELNDILSLSNQDKNTIVTMYNIWSSCLNKKIFIENVISRNIIIKDKIKIGTYLDNHNITQKSTLHFINCKNLSITIDRKVNHITIEKCKNINIKIIAGSISGIDTIKCENMNIIIKNKYVYYLDIGTSQECKINMEDELAINTVISSLNCFNIHFILANTKKMFTTNTSLLGSFNFFIFNKNNANTRLLCCTNNNIKEIRENK